MEHFILIDKNNIQIIKEIKNLFNINKEQELDSRIILYLNETLDDIKHTIKALIDDLMTLDKIYISGSKLNLNKELDLVLKYFDKLDKGINLAPDILKVSNNEDDCLNILLDKYYNDHNFLEILNTYFNNNLNVVSSANNLYMHRNTLLYKINNFYEQTGFNLKQFKDCALLYIYLQ